MNPFFLFLITFIVSFILWESQILSPLKHLAVYIHELWHSFVAMFFSMDEIHFHISGDETGKTIFKGNLSALKVIIIGLAGYLGTMFTGTFFLNRILKDEFNGSYFFLFIFILFFSSFVFVKIHTFTFLVGAGWSFVLLTLNFLNKDFVKIVLNVIFSFFIFYSFFDLFDLLDKNSNSDIAIIMEFLKKEGIFLLNEKITANFLNWIVILFYITVFYYYIIHLIFEKSEKSPDEITEQSMDEPNEKPVIDRVDNKNLEFLENTNLNENNKFF